MDHQVVFEEAIVIVFADGLAQNLLTLKFEHHGFNVKSAVTESGCGQRKLVDEVVAPSGAENQVQFVPRGLIDRHGRPVGDIQLVLRRTE